MPQISERERLELAARLDEELDEFIDSLPRREKQDNVPFDRWEEEITNHPFFMKEAPRPGDAAHPLYEGLQRLKYDPDENEPAELAAAYKDDGNFNFKHKKYRMAVISYTEGIKAQCGDAEIDASLHNNRSAAHYRLANYRSALLDAEVALKLKPDYDKAITRAAHCCYKLQKYDKAVEFCDRILEKNKSDEGALKLRKDCINDAKIKNRNERKREIAEKKRKIEEKTIIDEIKKRGIKTDRGSDNLTLTRLEPQFPELFNSRVSINASGDLQWPVIFFYPEYKIMDYIQQFNEKDTFIQQLMAVFEDYPQWDLERKYEPENLNVYFEDETRANIKIDVHKTLLEILKMEGHIVREGTPKFIILVRGSKAEQSFISQ